MRVLLATLLCLAGCGGFDCERACRENPPVCNDTSLCVSSPDRCEGGDVGRALTCEASGWMNH